MFKEDEKILNEFGWDVECFSPFEIVNHDGSIATGQAANLVLTDARIEYNEMQKQKELSSQLAAHFVPRGPEDFLCACMGYEDCIKLGCSSWWDSFLNNVTSDDILDMVKLLKDKKR